MTNSRLHRIRVHGVLLLCVLAFPVYAVALETPPESPVIECGDHVQAVLNAKEALGTGDRISAIRYLRRAQAALRACSIRSEAEEIAFG